MKLVVAENEGQQAPNLLKTIVSVLPHYWQDITLKYWNQDRKLIFRISAALVRVRLALLVRVVQDSFARRDRRGWETRRGRWVGWWNGVGQRDGGVLCGGGATAPCNTLACVSWREMIRIYYHPGLPYG